MSIAELCRRYGISRKTGYKWLGRWFTEGPEGLQDRDSRPRSSPRATAPEVVEAILEVRRKHTDDGAKKVTWYLERNRHDLELNRHDLEFPSRTTIHNILLRHGLVPERRGRMRRWHPGRPTTEATQPNAIWTTDFKGQFRTDGRTLLLPAHRAGASCSAARADSTCRSKAPSRSSSAVPRVRAAGADSL